MLLNVSLTALIALAGVTLTIWIGAGLGMSGHEIALCLLSANVCAMGALILTLRAERVGWVRRKVLKDSPRTYGLLVSAWFAGMLVLARPWWTAQNFFPLFLPLVFSTGVAVLVFGPIQDRMVAHLQRRARARS
jgi:putative effector of murein hydrolase LrgA (UPF0299 family)